MLLKNPSQNDINEFYVKCLDNTAPLSRWQDLGVLVFARACFPETFDSEFSEMHYVIIKEMFGFYHPKKVRRTERQGYINIHREAAKTTIVSFLFPLYQILFKGYQSYVLFDDGIHQIPIGEGFIVLCSETATAAENMTTNIKSVIEDRTDLIAYFGDKHPQDVEVDSEERQGKKLWRKNAFITHDGTVVYGIGSGQQIRGKNVLNRRPTLIVVDDMYSENNTATEERRAKLDRWFFAALVNSADSVRGKIMWVGTTVHLDTVITKMKKSDTWSGRTIPIIELEELKEALSHCKIDVDYIEIPKKEDCFKLQEKFTTLSWRRRHTLHAILSMYKEAYENRNLGYFYKEYLNITNPPEEASFPDSKFYFTSIKTYWDRNENELRYHISFEKDGLTWIAIVEFSTGIDIASGESKRTDDTAMITGCLCEFQAVIPGTTELLKKKLPVLIDCEGGKYGIYDDTTGAGTTKKGIADSIIRIAQKYPLRSVYIESNAQQGTIVREVRRNMTEKQCVVLGTRTAYSSGLRTQTLAVFSQTNKEERIKAVIGGLVQKYEFVVCNSEASLLRKVVTQLQTLGSSDHDDYADSFAILAKEFKLQSRPVFQERVPLKTLKHLNRRKSVDWETV